jgi:hypothetical protein
MSDEFSQIDAAAAEEYLAAFDQTTQVEGETLFRKGGVVALSCLVPNSSYCADVEDGETFKVVLMLDELAGRGAECTCSALGKCRHAYAAMKALLAEHSSAAVQALSAGVVHKAARPQRNANQSGRTPFAAKIAQALGRRLREEEADYVRQIEEVFARCQWTQRITGWEFETLGIRLNCEIWQPLEIWPSLPQDAHEFWLYVAYTAREQGRLTPEFLDAVTDLSVLEERLADWRRTREIKRWLKLMGSAKWELESQALPAVSAYDLRLVIGRKRAVLQWKRPGREHFEAFTTTLLHRFNMDYQEGAATLPLEAEVLWQLLQPHLAVGGRSELSYDAKGAVVVLSQLFRQPLLNSRLLTEAGVPFQRHPEPLRWDLVMPDGESKDYQLRLVCPDGRPAPPVLFVGPGSSPLYVTVDTIFTGPPAQGLPLALNADNRIPAPALESQEGVAFLQALRVQLPPNLRARIRHVPMRVLIQCELQPLYPGSAVEVCAIRALAEARDGSRREAWNGYNWVDETSRQGSRPASPNNDLVLYDRSTLVEAAELLVSLGLRPDNYADRLSIRVTKKFPKLFADWLRSIPPHITVELGGELASLAQADVVGKVRLAVSEAAIDWFDLRVVLDVTDTTLTPEEIRLVLNAKGNYVRLAGKGWRRLQFDLSQEDDEQLARLGLSPRALTAEPQRLHALQLADQAAKRFLPEDQVTVIERRASELKARVTPPLPASVRAQLRPYQLEGFHFLAYLAENRFGGILADDMGLGKTLQTLVWLAWLRETARGPSSAPSDRQAPSDRSATAPSLVVCPKSVMDNWCAEAERFLVGLRVRTWAASELHGFLDRLAEADLHVLNYNQLRLLGENLAAVRWLAVILDEGQYIKNPDSQTAQIARTLRAEHRLVLSGTPIENRLLDLWSLMAFAMPGLLGSRHQFAKLYDSTTDPFARRRLASRVRPFLLRRTKAQVAQDLPDRVEEDLLCEMEGEQQTLYRAELKRAQQLLLRVRTQEELNQERFHFLTSLLRLRQICCHPRLVKPDSTAPSAKVESLLDQLEPLMDEGHKVLVFSQFVELLDLLQPVLAERRWPLFYLTGDTERRGELIERFQAAEGAAVFLISLKAGGFGLNLTAASYVVLFDPWWNPAVENQAIDRTHRIGQTNKVIAYRLLIKHSIEEKIRTLQKQKKTLAEDVLGEEKFAQALSLDDLRFLFGDYDGAAAS